MQVTESNEDFASLLRSPRRLGMAGLSSANDDYACSDTEIVCWMQCMSIEDLHCGVESSIECVDPATKEIHDGGDMCTTCVPECIRK